MGSRIVTELNGWLASAAWCGWFQWPYRALAVAATADTTRPTTTSPARNQPIYKTGCARTEFRTRGETTAAAKQARPDTGAASNKAEPSPESRAARSERR